MLVKLAHDIHSKIIYDIKVIGLLRIRVEWQITDELKTAVILRLATTAFTACQTSGRYKFQMPDKSSY